MSRVRIDRRVYLTADRERAVEEGDPDARFLLCPAGGEVALADAMRFGLLASPTPEGKADLGEEDGGKEGAPKARGAGSKAARRPPNKARRAAANKNAGYGGGDGGGDGGP